MRAACPPSRYNRKSKEVRLQRLTGLALETVRRLKWDDEALWSFTDFRIGQYICTHLRHLGARPDSIVLDAFAGAGGTTIQFSRYFLSVVAVEADRERKKMLDHNLAVLSICNVTTRESYFQTIEGELTYDVVFFDPPWGANYRRAGPRLRISVCNGRHEAPSPACEPLECVVASTRRAAYAVVKLPQNYDMDHFSEYLAVHHVGEIVHTASISRPNTMVIVFVRYYPTAASG
jgi:16S rRNA G966 N2-methylase RsmD